MLKRFLSIFRANRQSTPPSQNSINNDPLTNQSWQSTSTEEITAGTFRDLDRLTVLFRNLCFLILAAFGVLLIVNYYLDLRLTSQKLLMDELTRETDALSPTATQAADVAKEIAFYEETLNNRLTLGQRSSAIFGNLNPNIKVNSATLDLDGFTLDIEVPDPFEFANLMDTYSKTGVINEISLESADLITARGVYKVLLKGNYK